MLDHRPSLVASQFQRIRTLILAAVGTLILSVVAVTSLALYQLRTSELDQAILVAKNLAIAIDQTVGGLLRSADNSMLSASDEIARQMTSGHIDAQSIDQYLTRQGSRVPHLSAIRGVTEQGDIAYGPGIQKPPVNVADRDYFISLKSDPNAGLIITEPLFARSDQEWVWALARRISKADGTFGGVIVGIIRLDELEKVLAAVPIADGDLIAIRDKEMGLIAHNSGGIKSNAQPGNNTMSVEFRSAYQLSKETGAYVGGTSSIDGIARIYYYQRNPQFGFTTIVGFSTESALAHWRQEAWAALGFLLVLTIMSLVFARYVNLSLSRQDEHADELAAEQLQSHTFEFFDPITKLPNRWLLQDRLAQSLVSSTRAGKVGALLMIDLDNFKTLNETLGHDVGDQLLQQAGERICGCVRIGDTVARVGGDEFVIILELLADRQTEAAIQAELFGHKILEALNQPYLLGEHPYTGSASAGITLFIDNEVSVDELLKQADIALYQAKHAGRNCLRFLDRTIQTNIAEQVVLEAELRSAIENEQFQLHYQIQVDQAGHPTGAEALVRWLHPVKGLLGAQQFIPLAEETGLIVPIGQWVMESACRQIKKWQDDPLTCDLVVSINVSVKQFIRPDFVEQVRSTLERQGANANRLKIELTEGVLLTDTKGAIEKMNVIKALGIQFSLDDFGTGFSSLQYLKKLPLDQLKIDQSFVKDLAVDNNDQVIVETIIAMAKALHLDVIAEGVETLQQKQFLLDHGCIHFQGYLFGKPVPVSDFEAMLKRS